MAEMTFDEIVTRALELTPAEQEQLIERLAAALDDQAAEADESEENRPLTDEEVAELMRQEPLAPAEVIERGLTGGWADMGITDGAEWVNERKRKRKARLKW